MDSKLRLDTMTHAQRAVFARRLFHPVRLRLNAATRLMLERIAKGGAK